jgi:hypothetical protein
MSAIITVKGHIFFPVNQMLLRAIYIGAVILNFIIPLAGICMLSGFIENQAVRKWSRAGPVLDKITPLSAHATPKKAIHIYIQCQTLSNPIPIDVNVENKHLRKQTSTKLLVEFLEEISRLEMYCLGSCRA